MKRNIFIKPIEMKKIFLLLVLIFGFFYLMGYGFSGYVFAKKYEVTDLLFDNSHFLKVDGVELHYRIWLPSKSTNHGNILLVHGLGGSTYSWRYVVSALIEKGYTAVAVDLPGFGLSQRKPAIHQSYENRASLLWKFIDIVSLEGPWHLAGHSMGGGIVAAMAVQKPHDIKSIILIDGSIEGRKSRFILFLLRPKIIRKIAGKFICRLFITKRKIKSFLKSAYGREPYPEEVEGYYRPLRLKNTYLTLSSLLRKDVSDRKLPNKLDKIIAPALCLWGNEDEWIPASKGKELIERIPDATLFLIDEAEHCPMETHPDILNRYLIRFLENLTLNHLNRKKR